MAEDDVADFSGSIAAQTAMLQNLDSATKLFGRSVTDAFSKGVIEGKRFEDVLKGIGLKLSQTVLKQAFKPVEAGISSLVGEGLKALGGAFGGLGGSLGAVAGPQVQAFADGGVVSAPTYFGMGRNLGLMGEAGAEAILPLARGPDGRLGVSAGGQGGAPISVNISIATPDAESFRRSEGQISAAVARAVSRGRRSL